MKKKQISAFASDVCGTVLAPGTAEYEQARMVWNGMMDRRPALIVRCYDRGGCHELCEVCQGA